MRRKTAATSTGSERNKSVPLARPSAVLTWSRVTPLAMSEVRGEITVAPLGALNTPANSMPVSTLVPLRTIMVLAQPAAKVNKPLTLVVTLTSPLSATPLPLLSHSTVASRR